VRPGIVTLIVDVRDYASVAVFAAARRDRHLLEDKTS
jgi:hypothetical protein